ncbi:MAG: hypothetical protein GX339_02445 [Tissierellia bacterium]|nr:hypothetical protein [Tissierellia bacterium]
MKKVIFVLSLVLLLVFTSVTVFADEITIRVDSVEVEFNDDLGFPFIDENNRTLVPFRATLEEYGAEVDWNNESRTAVATKDEIVVEVAVDENYIIKNGEEIAVDTAARIVNGRTFLPIRAVIEAFGSEVQWDSSLNTVVITTDPIDAKAIYLEAANKSHNWKNYDLKASINMSMEVPDESGSLQAMDMNMDMDMTIFMDPFKAKVNVAVPVTVMDVELMEMMMEMYMVVNEEGYTTYTGAGDKTGEFTWFKQTIEDEMMSQLLKFDEETMAKNQELTEKYTKDVKYLGDYIDSEGNTLLRLEYTMSGDIYKEIFDEYLNLMPEATNEQEAMVIEMIESFANFDLGDLTYIVYIHGETGEMVKMEMDLASMVATMMSGMTEILGEIPQEALDMLNNLEVFMEAEFLNINEAEDFEIPEEALNAPEITEMLEEFEQLEGIELPEEADELR